METLCEKVCFKWTLQNSQWWINYDGSRQGDCSLQVDQRQRRRGLPMFSVMSSAREDLQKTRNADDAVVQCSRQNRWCFSGIGVVLQWFHSYIVGRSQHACMSQIHSCPSDLQRHCAWISAVVFHLTGRHDVKTTVVVLSLPLSGTSSSVYCRQASLPSFRC